MKSPSRSNHVAVDQGYPKDPQGTLRGTQVTEDLDACLWSPEMFQLDSGAPSEYCRKRGGVVAGRDTDAWLVNKGGATLFPDDFPFHIFIYGRFENGKVS